MSGLRGTIHDRRETEALQRLSGERGPRAASAVLQQQAKVLERIIAASLANLEGTREVLAAAQQELATLQQDQGNLSGRLSTAESDITSLSGDITSLSGDFTSLSGDVGDLSGDLSALSGEVGSLRTAAGAVIVPALTSADVSAPPDETEYNDLRADVTALRQAVLDLQGAVS